MCHALPAELPDLHEPTAPFADPIIQIHRGPDAWVSFHRKRDDRWEDIGSVRTADLRTMFPQLVKELERDSYFSINSFWRSGRGSGLLGLPRAHRKGADARYLNACFVDLDIHLNRSLDWGLWLGVVVNAQDRGAIPPASLICRSGRGLWLLWLLHQEADPRLPPRAFPEQVLLFQALEHELSRRLQNIAAQHIDHGPVADSAVKDVARVMRVPGSINSEVFPGDPPRVHFWPQLSGSGKGYSYSLRELAILVGVSVPELRPNRRRQSEPEARERGLRGWRALWQLRLEDFETLRGMRGTFRKGCRNRSAYIYGVILRGVGFTDATIDDAVTRFGRECSPPLSAREINDAIEQSRESRGQLRDSTIADFLTVTPEEGRRIPRWAEKVPLVEGKSVDMNLTNTARIELRKRTILEIAEPLGRLPSTRQMARLLQQRGICTSHVQVSRDYARLQLNSGDRATFLFPVTDVTLVGRELGE